MISASRVRPGAELVAGEVGSAGWVGSGWVPLGAVGGATTGVACAAAGEAVLNRQPGVLAASSHFAADAAVVEWDASVTSLETLRAAVARLGYAVRTLSEPADAATQRELKLGARLAVALFSGMWAMLAVAGLYFGQP